jgi:DNA polymerase
MSASVDIREVLRQHLETEKLLGVQEVPRPSVPPQSTASVASPTADIAAPLPEKPHTMPISAEELAARVAVLKQMDDEGVSVCVKCHLCKARTKTVFGQGHAAARLVFVGEAPGFEEDQQGLAFVGRAGQLLTQMIGAMGLGRDDVFICNVLKCRPPNNRTPADDEIAACSPYLFEQLRTIQPEVIVALGAPASQTLLNTKESIGRLRGRFHNFYISGSPLVGPPTPLMPTYHPAYLLRSPGEKRKAWEDLMKVMEFLGLPIPEKYR